MPFDPYKRSVKWEMSPQVVTARPDASVVEALVLMQEEQISVLPLVDDADRCVGVFSASDLTRVADGMADVAGEIESLSTSSRQLLMEKLVERGMSQRPIGEIASGNLVTTGPDVTLGEAGREMLKRRVHHLLIIDEQQRLLGIISSLDLLAAFVKASPDDVQ